MKTGKYANIGIDANRDKFWSGVDSSYRNLKLLVVVMAALAFGFQMVM